MLLLCSTLQDRLCFRAGPFSRRSMLLQTRAPQQLALLAEVRLQGHDLRLQCAVGRLCSLQGIAQSYITA
jgi:hypothetical protein